MTNLEKLEALIESNEAEYTELIHNVCEDAFDVSLSTEYSVRYETVIVRGYDDYVKHCIEYASDELSKWLNIPLSDTKVLVSDNLIEVFDTELLSESAYIKRGEHEWEEDSFWQYLDECEARSDFEDWTGGDFD